MFERSLAAVADGGRISLIAVSIALMQPLSRTLHYCLSHSSVCLSSSSSSLLPSETSPLSHLING